MDVITKLCDIRSKFRAISCMDVRCYVQQVLGMRRRGRPTTERWGSAPETDWGVMTNVIAACQETRQDTLVPHGGSLTMDARLLSRKWDSDIRDFMWWIRGVDITKPNLCQHITIKSELSQCRWKILFGICHIPLGCGMPLPILNNVAPESG